MLTTMDRMELNDWLKVKLANMNWTQLELAKKSGLDPSQISRLIHGDRKPSIDIVIAISKALMLDNDEFMWVMGWRDEKPPKDEEAEKCMSILSQLNEEERQEVLSFAKFKKEQQGIDDRRGVKELPMSDE